MNRNTSMAGRALFAALLPVFIYIVISYIASFAVQYIAGPSPRYAAYATTLAALIALPFLVRLFAGRALIHGSRILILFAPAGGALISVGSSYLMRITGIYEQFSNDAQESLYQAPLWLAVAGLCVIVPIAEELVYRGLMYTRLKVFMPPVAAALVMSILFAAGHGNFIQAFYAFPSGLILAWFMEKSGLAAAILFHIGANLISVILM